MRKHALLADQPKVTHGWEVISKHSSEVYLKDIRNIAIDYGVVERMFGIGSVGIASSTARTFEVQFRGIEQPDKVKELILQAKEQLESDFERM